MENVGEAIKKQLLWQQLQSTAGLLPVPERREPGMDGTNVTDATSLSSEFVKDKNQVLNLSIFI